MMRRTFARPSPRPTRQCHVDKESRGFTLIELLTVVVVIGVVSTVAAMAFGRLNEKSMSAACSADATKISNAVALVKAQYPGTTVNESILMSRGGAYDGPYLVSWPNNRRFVNHVRHHVGRRRAVRGSHRVHGCDVVKQSISIERFLSVT